MSQSLMFNGPEPALCFNRLNIVLRPTSSFFDIAQSRSRCNRPFAGLMCSPLHAAALHCDPAVLRALIESNAHVNAMAEAGLNPAVQLLVAGAYKGFAKRFLWNCRAGISSGGWGGSSPQSHRISRFTRISVAFVPFCKIRIHCSWNGRQLWDWYSLRFLQIKVMIARDVFCEEARRFVNCDFCCA